jgi:hypothetical protein
VVEAAFLGKSPSTTRTIWHPFHSELMTERTMDMNLVSTERTKWLCHIHSIATVWTFLIRHKTFDDILWGVETLLDTIDEIAKYRDDEDWPEKLHEKEKWREDRYPSEKEFEELVRDDIPEKKYKYL